MKKIPLGLANFKTMIEENHYYVDKSLFIREAWDDADAILITRPRRFGKTLNMSMVKYFFDNREDNKHLFKNLKISKDEELMDLCGKIPVIFLSFRGCGGENLEITKKLIIHEIKRELLSFKYLKEYLNDDDLKLSLQTLINSEDEGDIIKSISTLCELIYIAFEIKPILLIDEYDNPINNAYVQDFYEPLIKFFKPFYENTLKNNDYVKKSIITGVLRVSKESIFSGLNNLRVHTILSPKFNDKFGFTETEVHEFLTYYNIEYQMDDVKNYYNGYKFGSSEIFNPWSIVNYGDYMLAPGGLSRDFWINTSGNDIVYKLMSKNTSKHRKDIEKLLRGEEIIKIIDENTVFKHLENKVDNPWSLLLFAGYLNATRFIDRKKLALKLPNKEVENIFKDVILEWVSTDYDEASYHMLIEALIDGDMDTFEVEFKELIFSTMSFFDPSGEHPENFYHGFVLGVLALLIDNYNIKYNIKSNREAGRGRSDIMIIPKDNSKLGIVIEFKKAKSIETLDEFAKEALNQIYEKKYSEEIKSFGIEDIMQVGISFFGKECEMIYERL